VKLWRTYYRTRDVIAGALWALFAHSRWPSKRTDR
jgi:hypothetical protein